jgi:hypothetical protein
VTEWGDWECPECRVKETDPDFLFATVCRNGHAVLLGVVENGWRWASPFDKRRDFSGDGI